jgi:hypothetical protein
MIVIIIISEEACYVFCIWIRTRGISNAAMRKCILGNDFLALSAQYKNMSVI